jgi:hypothetical protein
MDKQELVIRLEYRTAKLLAGTALVALFGVPMALSASGLSVPHIFSNGTVADADEVNANFAAVKGSVDDNDARISANEAAIAALQAVVPTGDGSTPSDAGASFQSIKLDFPASTTGEYWIDPEGDDVAVRVYCDMNTDGGGWTLVSRVVLNANIAQTGAVGSTPVLPDQASFGKLSDATINAIRALPHYAGSTDIRMTCDFSTPITQFCSSTCSFGSNNVVNSTAGCNQCSQSFEGPLTSLSPNEGTRGFGHHHQTGWFAYQSTHYNSNGCHADQYNGINNGNASGVMWVK